MEELSCSNPALSLAARSHVVNRNKKAATKGGSKTTNTTHILLTAADEQKPSDRQNTESDTRRLWNGRILNTEATQTNQVRRLLPASVPSLRSVSWRSYCESADSGIASHCACALWDCVLVVSEIPDGLKASLQKSLLFIAI